MQSLLCFVIEYDVMTEKTEDGKGEHGGGTGEMGEKKEGKGAERNAKKLVGLCVFLPGARSWLIGLESFRFLACEWREPLSSCVLLLLFWHCFHFSFPTHTFYLSSRTVIDRLRGVLLLEWV